MYMNISLNQKQIEPSIALPFSHSVLIRFSNLVHGLFALTVEDVSCADMYSSVERLFLLIVQNFIFKSWVI